MTKLNGNLAETPAADQPAGRSTGPAEALDIPRPGRVDAVALQSMLAERFGVQHDDPVSAEQPAPALQASNHAASRLLKSLAALALLIGVGWMPAQRLFQVSSVEAVTNARLVTIRAPIAGVVAAGAPALQAGADVAADTVLTAIDNPQASAAALDSAEDRLATASAERQGRAATLAQLQSIQADLRRQVEAYRANRLADLDARIEGAEARIARAQALKVHAAGEGARLVKLRKAGSAKQTAVDLARRDLKVAAADVAEAEAARKSLGIERDTLTAGFYLGDDYNDEPRSTQRLDEVAVQISTVKGDIVRLDADIARADTEASRQRLAFAAASQAKLAAPMEGRIWQVLTAPGEQVGAGQELYTILDCSRPLVTATVSETTYNGLTIGTPATFSFSNGGDRTGHVVQLTGPAEASSNYAIKPSMLSKEAYRVAVALDGTKADSACPVGRTGRVVFGSGN